MAIKERKQVSGTTAQIKSYAGHEGQIVWDTDKKTFVGMSGTAGTNYPLATQEYADNKTSNLEGKVDTYNAAITEALNKKENAGVCLPLTGGIMNGPLFFTDGTHIWAVTDANLKGLEIGGGNTFKSGATLFLRSNDATGEQESGQFGLAAHNASSDEEGLLLGTTKNLWFKGEMLERSSGFFDKQTEDGFYSVYRYTTGLQIITARVTIPVNQSVLTFTFPSPFKDTLYSTSGNALADSGDLDITFGEDTPTSVKIYRKQNSQSFNFKAYIKCTFIGKWK